MRTVPLALFAVFAATLPAAASGGFSCLAGDQSLAFKAEAATSRGMGGVFLDFRASVAVKLDGVSDDLRSVTLDGALTHSWIDGDEVKLQFYHERQVEPFGSLDLVVEAAAVDEGAYRGHYTLTIFDTPARDDADREMWTAEGYATCYAE
jgi:hypothetical protein